MNGIMIINEIRKKTNEKIEEIMIIDEIRRKTNDKIETFLKKLGIEFNTLTEFINNPYTYIGCVDKLNLIIDISLRYSIGENYSKIQKSHLRIIEVYHSIYNQINNKN